MNIGLRCRLSAEAHAHGIGRQRGGDRLGTIVGERYDECWVVQWDGLKKPTVYAKGFISLVDAQGFPVSSELVRSPSKEC